MQISQQPTTHRAIQSYLVPQKGMSETSRRVDIDICEPLLREHASPPIYIAPPPMEKYTGQNVIHNTGTLIVVNNADKKPVPPAEWWLGVEFILLSAYVLSTTLWMIFSGG